MKKIFLHGSGHKAESWNATLARMKNREDILCPDLAAVLGEKEAAYENLYAAFVQYCQKAGERPALCGLSLGGILALDYALDFPDQVDSLVLIGTPYQVPKLLFGIQNMVFRCLPSSFFQGAAFGKQDTFALGRSMKNLDFSGRLQNIRCRTLVLCGEKDRANRKAAEYLGKHIENAALKIIERTGHVVNEENPEALAGILNEFYGEKEGRPEALGWI
ncbi:alpha/beta fold hydrolase [Acutalibacter intestini]|uniref:alpha/beta fold hydrolase n=1 Tax=Acutalibacter intestini TaxID=3093659 RepID=UPI002AC99FD4|nr:alpha/beta hydrolase [Acutalibacter sp. M00204]